MKKSYISLSAVILFLSVSFAQNKQLLYDGIDDLCNLPTAEILFSNLNVFTVEAWINSSNISNNPIFIGSGSTEILFGITSAGQLAFGTSYFSGGPLVFALPGTFPANGTWHHIACVRIGTGAGQGKIYIDGVDQTDPSVNTTGAAIPLGGNLTFGVGLTTFYLNGAMDEIRIWNVARTQTQINNSMNIQLAGNETGLIGYWQFNEGTGQTIFDNQTNGPTNNGTLGANASPGSDDPTRIQDPGLPLPVELVSFSSIVNENNVELNWITATEANNLGFDIERKSESSSYIKVGFVSGNGTKTGYSHYSFVDIVAQPGIYNYRLKQIDFDGSFKYSNIIQVAVESIPLIFSLEQNYPNPFNPSTTISYTLPEAGYTNLTVYNSLGEKVAELINENENSGKHSVIFSAANLSSGLYIYKLNLNSENNTYTISKIMSLVK